MTTKKVLIVDDEERIRELVQVILEDLAGWDTITAASETECLTIATTQPIEYKPSQMVSIWSKTGKG